MRSWGACRGYAGQVPRAKNSGLTGLRSSRRPATDGIRRVLAARAPAGLQRRLGAERDFFAEHQGPVEAVAESRRSPC
jgi:hypothetical protein